MEVESTAMQQLQGLRLERGVSLETMGKQMGKRRSKQAMSELERNPNPRLGDVLDYAEALGVQVKMEVKKVRCLTIFNHAGGVGKSAITRELGFYLASLGFKTLLIDADAQADLTEMYGIDASEIEKEQTLYHTFASSGELPPAMDLGQGGKLKIIPSCIDVAEVERLLLAEEGGEVLLRRAVNKVREDYDFVLIDAPPSLGKLGYTCAVAADELIIPTTVKGKGIRALRRIVDKLESFQRTSPDLRIGFIVINNFDRTRYSKDQENLDAISEQLLEIAPFGSPIGQRRYFEDAIARSQPILECMPKTEAATELRAALSQLLEALEVKVFAHV